MDLGKLVQLSQRRECLKCGAVFETNDELTAYQQFADHDRIHSTPPEVWDAIHKDIQKIRQQRERG